MFERGLLVDATKGEGLGFFGIESLDGNEFVAFATNAGVSIEFRTVTESAER